MNLNKKGLFSNPLTSWRLILQFSILLLLAACGKQHPPSIDLVISTADGRSIEVYPRLAVTAAEKRKGLYDDDAINPFEGMLFIYGSDKHLTYRMRGSRNDLSVAFIDSAGSILEIYNMLIDPTTVYRSSDKCRFALQMAYNWYRENEVSVGDKALIPPEIRKLKPLF